MPPEKPHAEVMAPIRVLVAVPTPLQRSLVRFFLEEAGFQMLPAGSPVELMAAATNHRPDAVVLHEDLASSEDAGFVQRVRRASPSARIVVLAKEPHEAWRGPSRGADAYLEEWIGIADLEDILSTPGFNAPAPGGASAVAAAAIGRPLETRHDAPVTRP